MFKIIAFILATAFFYLWNMRREKIKGYKEW